LQKLVSHLEIHKVSLSQEDVNLKFLQSLPFEWKTHTLIWRNKADLKEQSLDDLFNSLKIYEAKVKSSSSIGTATQNLAFMSSSNTDSTTESVSAAASVFAVCAKMHATFLPNVDSLKVEPTNYAFMAFSSLSSSSDNEHAETSIPAATPKLTSPKPTSNGKRRNRKACFVCKSLDHLIKDCNYHEKQMVQPTNRNHAHRGRNLDDNRPTSMGFDMSKVKCYNYHKKGHFARECRSPKVSRRPGAADPQRRTVPVETSTSNALVSQCDGIRSYDQSYQAEEEPANFDLMAFYPSSTSSDKELSTSKPAQDLSHINRPSVPIIEYWVSDSEDESETTAP
nr:hypothetical protein [Tanacetum cinerariifolium]